MNAISDKQFSNWGRRISDDDTNAFRELFDGTFENYVRYAWRFTKDKESAKDIVQECFVKLWQMRANIDPSQSLKAYLYRMVKHTSLNHLRDNLKEIETEDFDELKMAEEQTGISSEETQSPLIKPLKEWISELPDRQKEAFKLSRYEGLTHEEIAEVMNVSPRTVNNHIGAALNNLQARYKTYKDVNRNTL